MTERAKFIEADLYEAPKTLPELGSFDLVFGTWGAINWLPDIRRWAGVVAYFLRPGGALYLADGHPCVSMAGSALVATCFFTEGRARVAKAGFT